MTDALANFVPPHSVPKPQPSAEVLRAGTLGGLKIEPIAPVPEYLNILLYGDSGVGKTVLAGSASVVKEMAPVLFIDIEGGTMSLSHSYPDCERVRVKTWADMQKVYDDLYAGKGGYKTVVVDSLTEAQKFSMDRIMIDLSKTGRKSGADVDVDTPSEKEWGKNINQIRFMVRAFRDLPLNVVFTALRKEDKERSGLMLTKPSLPGKLAGEVAAFVDVVCYYYMKSKDGATNRYLLTKGTEAQVAKDRSDRLPTVVENPTMEKLYDLMFNQPTTKEKK